MPRIRQLSGERCYLTPPLVEDAADWHAWLSDLRVSLPLGDEAYAPVSIAALQQLIEAPGEHCRLFALCLVADDRPIGRGILFNLDFINRSGELGLFIGAPACWGQGLGREATALLLDYAFGLLNLNSVMLGAFAFNERALACYRSVGFREIGRRRAARIVAGRAYDVVLMDLLASEFDSHQVAKLLNDA